MKKHDPCSDAKKDDDATGTVFQSENKMDGGIGNSDQERDQAGVQLQAFLQIPSEQGNEGTLHAAARAVDAQQALGRAHQHVVFQETGKAHTKNPG